ncbi:MAG: response regulator transcription factor [Anaerolineae bacterium]
MIKVWIVARLPLIREGLRGLLVSEKDFVVTAPALVDSGTLVRALVQDPPDVVLLDVDVLEREGWGFVRDLAQMAPAVAQLVVGDTPDDRRVTQALGLGVRGYLLREASPQEMIAAVRAAGQGLYVLHPGVASSLLNALQAGRLRRAPDGVSSLADNDERDADLIEPLSERELEVLRLIVRGLANKQIAAQLFITEHTVKFHIRAILGKLGAANRTEAVTLALQKGLVSL